MNSRSSQYAVVGVIFLAVVGAVSVLRAQSSLEADLVLFEEALEEIEGEQETRQEEIERESDEELFPEVDPDEFAGVRGAAPEEEKSLVIRVNGVPVTLEDVSLLSWFAPYVRSVAQRGIVSGYKDAQGLPTGFFGPADSITIEQLAKVVVEAVGIDQTQCEGELRNDGAEDRWSERYILCAESLNWVVFSDGSVDVTQPANRSQVIVTVLQGFKASMQSPNGDTFSDVSISVEFAGAIETAAQDGIVSGYTDEDGNETGEFGPLDPVNRAQAAKILSLAAQVYEK